MNRRWIAAAAIAGSSVAPASAVSPATFDRTIDLRFETVASAALTAAERTRLDELVSTMESRGECAVDYVLLSGTRKSGTPARSLSREEHLTPPSRRERYLSLLTPQSHRERYLSDLLKRRHLGVLIFDDNSPASISSGTVRLTIHGNMRQAPCQITTRAQ